MFYVTQTLLDEYKDWLYSLSKAICIYGGEPKLTLAKPRKIISKDTQVEVLKEDNLNVVEKVVTTVIQKREKCGNIYTIPLDKMPSNLSQLSDILGMSRQHLGTHKEEWNKMRENGCFEMNFRDSYFDLSKKQLEFILNVVSEESPQARNKVLAMFFFMLIKINRYGDYRHTYLQIAYEAGVSKDFAMKVIREMILRDIIEITHYGSNLSGLANSYGMTEDFKELK